MNDDAFVSLPDMIAAHAAQRGDHDAIIQDGRSLSYRELDAAMDRVAAALQREGLKPRDTVAICAGTSIEYACVFLGALRAGVAVAPIAPTSTAEGIVTMVADSGAKVFFVDKGVSDALSAHLRDLRILAGRRVAADAIDLDAGRGEIANLRVRETRR